MPYSNFSSCIQGNIDIPYTFNDALTEWMEAAQQNRWFLLLLLKLFEPDPVSPDCLAEAFLIKIYFILF